MPGMDFKKKGYDMVTKTWMIQCLRMVRKTESHKLLERYGNQERRTNSRRLNPCSGKNPKTHIAARLSLHLFVIAMMPLNNVIHPPAEQ